MALLDSIAIGKDSENILSFRRYFLSKNYVLECAHYLFYINFCWKKSLVVSILEVFFSRNFHSVLSLKVTSTRKLYFPVLLHLIYHEWVFDSKKKLSFFSRYLDFCVFVEATNFKICDIIFEISSLTLSFVSLQP